MCATPHRSRRTRTGSLSPGTCSSPEVTATVSCPSSLREDDGFAGATAHNEIDTTNVENNFMAAGAICMNRREPATVNHPPSVLVGQVHSPTSQCAWLIYGTNPRSYDPRQTVRRIVVARFSYPRA